MFHFPCDSDRLNLPSVLVLNSCGITCAGDEKEIAAFCAHVSELDLSDNKLEDWHEVKLLVRQASKIQTLPHRSFSGVKNTNTCNMGVKTRKPY